jgi:hypothetical protein
MAQRSNHSDFQNFCPLPWIRERKAKSLAVPQTFLGESLIRVPETQSAFHRYAQRNAFRRRDVISNVIETHERTGDFKEW